LLVALAACLLIAVAACGDADDSSAAQTTTTTAEATTSTTAAPTTSTTAFEGSTSPTSVASTASGTALLTDVQVGDGVVTLVFRDELPGYTVRYVDPPITQDGSGAEVDVKGNAFLSV